MSPRDIGKILDAPNASQGHVRHCAYAQMHGRTAKDFPTFLREDWIPAKGDQSAALATDVREGSLVEIITGVVRSIMGERTLDAVNPEQVAAPAKPSKPKKGALVEGATVTYVPTGSTWTVTKVGVKGGSHFAATNGKRESRFANSLVKSGLIRVS